jgi:hypothetical protein
MITISIKFIEDIYLTTSAENLLNSFGTPAPSQQYKKFKSSYYSPYENTAVI